MSSAQRMFEFLVNIRSPELFAFRDKMNKKIAFFIDGGYFIKRMKFYYRKYFNGCGVDLTRRRVVKDLYTFIKRHRDSLERQDLYRIYYYDAPPFDGQYREAVPKLEHRASNGTPSTKNFKTDPSTIFQQELHSSLKKSRKLALRMGKLSKAKRWIMDERAQKSILTGEKDINELVPEDFYLDVKQKGVDTRIGIDITTVTLRKFADTIVLIASDADFVPAAKLARTHGVDVVLDPMHGDVDQDLQLHIDGKKSYDIVHLLSECLAVRPTTTPNWWNENR